MRASAKKLSIGWAAAVASLVLGAAGSATAQGTGTASGQVGFQGTPQLSGQQQTAQAVTIMAKMDAAAQSVTLLLEHARAVRDVVKTLGLSDKLSQINVARRSAATQQSTMLAAIASGDTELANHEFTMMTVLLARVEQLVAEANQVVGSEMAFVGNTSVTSSAPDDLPTIGDTNGFPGPPIPSTNGATPPNVPMPPVPPPVSPFK
jgi:hypothetical protein